jgi:hypothetical protein
MIILVACALAVAANFLGRRSPSQTADSPGGSAAIANAVSAVAIAVAFAVAVAVTFAVTAAITVGIANLVADLIVNHVAVLAR